MVKVIEKQRKIMIKKCWNCGSILEYEKEDIFQKKVSLCEHISFMCDHITCPECNIEIQINSGSSLEDARSRK